MKNTIRKIAIFMLMIVIISCNLCFTFAEQKPTVKVYDNRYDCLIINSRTYIPMRAVFEALGYTVDWLPDVKAVVLTKDNVEVILFTKTNTVTGYGVLKNPVKIVNDRTYLPFRELLNVLGYQVEWNADTKTAIVVLPDTETTTEVTTVITTTTTEVTTETTTDIVYENKDLYVNDTPVGSKQELVDKVFDNIMHKRPTVEELIAMVSIDDEFNELEM